MAARFQSSALALAAAIIVTAVFLAGCGGSDSNTAGSTGSSGTSETGTGGSEASGELAAAAKHFQAFVGGEPGQADSSLKPVTFGFLNDEGGTVSFPESTLAMETAVKFVNEYLGGVEGHPLVVEKCLIASGEEQGQACAQQFRNSTDVLGTITGGDIVGPEAFQQTMDGAKPTIIGGAASTADATAKDGYGLTAGIFGNLPGFTEAARVFGAKSASVLFPDDDPAGQLAAKAAKEALEEQGVKVTTGGFNSKATSLLASVTASGAGQTDMVVGILPAPSLCIAAAEALEQVAPEEPVISISSCSAKGVEEGLGELPHWTFTSPTENNLDPSSSPDVAAYLEVMEKYLGSEANTTNQAQVAFMGVLVAARMATEVGAEKATPETINQALMSYRGPTPMGPPLKPRGTVNPEYPAVLTSQIRLFTYEGEGKWSEPGGGGWLG